jgi:hypothetical protein
MTLSDLLTSLGYDPSAITVVHDNAKCPSQEMLESSSPFRRLRKSRRSVHDSTALRLPPTTPPPSRWDAMPCFSPEKLYNCSVRNGGIKGGTATHKMTLNNFARIGAPPLTTLPMDDPKKRQWGEKTSAGSSSKPSHGNAATGFRKSCLPLRVPTRRYSHEDTASLLQRALAEIDFSDETDEE